MPVASPAFVNLCQAQFQLLHQTLGAISAVVYVAEAATATPPDFVPIFRYPRADAQVELEGATRRLPVPLSRAPVDTRAPVDKSSDASSDPTAEEISAANLSSLQSRPPEPHSPEQHPPEQQLVLPLIHQETVVGAMVILHHERCWRRDERQHLQQVADGVAAGYVLERQNHWLQQQLQVKRQLQGQQSEVFHNLLHQFRNPLTALGTFGKLLLKRLPTEDPNRTIATSIVRESERLSDLVQDFDHTVEMGDASWQSGAAAETAGLTTDERPPALTGERSPTQLLPAAEDRLTAGLGHELTLVTQPLRPLLEPLVALGQTLAVDRQIQFVGVLPAMPQTVAVDAQALQEVIRNLLDNALKYAGAGNWAWLQAAVRIGDTARVGIAVGDTGDGIPLVDQARLFERYYRGIQADGQLPGTGLGLAIARDLVTQMQGEIELISPLSTAAQTWVPPEVQAQGFPRAGTLFIVWLPAVEATEVLG